MSIGNVLSEIWMKIFYGINLQCENFVIKKISDSFNVAYLNEEDFFKIL